MSMPLALLAHFCLLQLHSTSSVQPLTEHPACSILVANNGLAAVKFISYVRRWASEAFGHDRAVTFVAMATPEDMRINAEHIRLADQFMEVRLLLSVALQARTIGRQSVVVAMPVDMRINARPPA